MMVEISEGNLGKTTTFSVEGNFGNGKWNLCPPVVCAIYYQVGECMQVYQLL